MNYRALAAFGISVALFSGHASAQDDDDDDTTATAKKGDAAAPADAAKAPATAAVDASATAKAKAPDAHEEVATVASEPTETSPAPERAPIYGKRGDWFMAPYGYARLDAIEDSTQSFADGIQPNLIARPGTYRGDHQRSNLTARDSRLGFFVGAPQYEGVRSSAQIEFDFYGLEPTDARAADTVIFGTPRIRHAFLKLETKAVDIVAGQYYDLFGWGSYFYPATVAYLGVPGMVYHRAPQLRLEKKIHAGDLEVMVAVAAVRAGERDSGVPDGQAGLKIAYNGWSGAAMPGFGRPVQAPLSIGVSGVFRHFQMPAFEAEPGSHSVSTNGSGVSIDALIPIIPVKTLEDHGNALTFTGEFSAGTGIADMYTGMDGGSRLPVLPNPNNNPITPTYSGSVDPGLVTFDRNSNLKSINWQAFVLGGQYYLPIGGGRVWVAGIYSQIKSNNIKTLTPFTSYGGIFTKMEYIDANLGWDITPALVVGLSFQTVKQTFGDVSAPDPIYGANPGTSLGSVATSKPGTGGVPASARNNRGQLSLALFF
jgi:hypothetical protein